MLSIPIMKFGSLYQISTPEIGMSDLMALISDIQGTYSSGQHKTAQAIDKTAQAATTGTTINIIISIIIHTAAATAAAVAAAVKHPPR